MQKLPSRCKSATSLPLPVNICSGNTLASGDIFAGYFTAILPSLRSFPCDCITVRLQNKSSSNERGRCPGKSGIDSCYRQLNLVDLLSYSPSSYTLNHLWRFAFIFFFLIAMVVPAFWSWPSFFFSVRYQLCGTL
ncbi:hypothetical protein MPTK1_5g11890 [Marchantia polymorpha subsp. ruderalis]|uniref:Uncharacterized protein n=2 Tax=Marchantia polymorpha TaxID=3197 RepID=A0AAF6BHF5_MARPO|nr:hypothetical protein MARPO_0143s0017 [Marchantia polymorpha]BBN11439.1 hypothetical protein Mp_5g11890 [Marchantia polymorpha subsp. ruderalis]|eukprot:PTQ29337.1 hypothetical protein MARPO_0143s0017 [Marchantia polymorpha]